MARSISIIAGAALVVALASCAVPVRAPDATGRAASAPMTIPVIVADPRAACPPAPLGARFEAQVPRDGRHDGALLDAAVLHHVNLVRCARGLGALRPDARLTAAATDHARDMARLDFFGHRSPVAGKRTLRARLERAGVSARSVGENLVEGNFVAYENGSRYWIVNEPACVFRDSSRQILPRHTYRSMAREFVERWMGSPGHRRVLLKPTLSRHGAGMAPNSVGELCGGLYAAQAFAG